MVAGFVHLFSIYEREGESFEASVDVHEVESSGWGGLSDESDVGRNKVCSANVVNEDSVMEVISFREEAIKGVGELRRKDDCLPFSMVSGSVEMGHGVTEAFMEIWVRGGGS